MNRRTAAVVVSIALAACTTTISAAVGATPPPPAPSSAAPTTVPVTGLPPTTEAVDTSFLRGEAEAQFLAANGGATQVACAVPPADEPGVLFNCYGVGGDGSLIAAVATMNDDGGIEFDPLDAATADAGGATTTAAPAVTSGTGSAVVAVRPPTGPSIVTISHDGAGGFAVQPQNAGAPIGSPFAVATGAVSGDHLVVFTSPVTDFAVTADGAWTIEVAAASTAAPFPVDMTTTGEAPVVLALPDGGELPVSVEYQGSGPIVISTFTAAGLQVVLDEAGPFTGEAVLPSGPGYVGIDAIGPWTVRPLASQPDSTAVG
jgi:hypothetical protein